MYVAARQMYISLPDDPRRCPSLVSSTAIKYCDLLVPPKKTNTSELGSNLQ